MRVHHDLAVRLNMLHLQKTSSTDGVIWHAAVALMHTTRACPCIIRHTQNTNDLDGPRLLHHTMANMSTADQVAAFREFTCVQVQTAVSVQLPQPCCVWSTMLNHLQLFVRTSELLSN